ncbi:MAG: hypothetical protein EKK29_06120 [Hyphomicrobiales bacterium]|nr:MAG: hypothetical protein EKK29_06120 [Hyphomicrobiales bacterium]
MIEKQLSETVASIGAAEKSVEEQSSLAAAPEAGKQESDVFAELLIARLLRIAHRDTLLRELSTRFLRRFRGR